MYPVNAIFREIWVIIPSSIHVAGLSEDEMPKENEKCEGKDSKGI